MMYCAIRRVGSTRDPMGDVGADIDDVWRSTVSRGRWVPDADRHASIARPSDPRPDMTSRPPGDRRALVETVALLEAAAIALGAGGLSAASIRTARAADRELRACRHDPDTAVRWARLFHHTLLNACPNRHMLELIDVESFSCGTVTATAAVGFDEVGRVSADHEAILDMIAAGAPRVELERSLRRHASTSTLCSMGRLGG